MPGAHHEFHGQDARMYSLLGVLSWAATSDLLDTGPTRRTTAAVVAVSVAALYSHAAGVLVVIAMLAYGTA